MKQSEVLEKFKAGWKLERWVGINPHWVIINPDINKMESFNVHYGTGVKLARMKGVKQIGESFPVETFIWVGMQ